jgi:hypothetical protein
VLIPSGMESLCRSLFNETRGAVYRTAPRSSTNSRRFRSHVADWLPLGRRVHNLKEPRCQMRPIDWREQSPPKIAGK